MSFRDFTRPVVVIGGGASGMMAAIRASEAYPEVVLIEKNGKLGKKLYITGKGRCNFTNLCPVEDFLQHVPRNPRFLYSALRFLPPQDMVSLLESYGCPTKIERGRRAFPVSDHASDVTAALKKQLDKNGVRILLNTRVCRVAVDSSEFPSVSHVTLEDGSEIAAGAVIVATGGLSYPSTGSDGDGYAFASAVGHRIRPCFPSLTGMEVTHPLIPVLQGVSLKNVKLSVFLREKLLMSETGEMLFTHWGLSGPLILQASSLVCREDLSLVRLELDLKPGLTSEQLDARIRRDIGENGKAQVRTLARRLLPGKMSDPVLEMLSVPGDRPSAALTAKERQSLTEGLKRMVFLPSALRGYQEAVITSGGVDTKEINPSTMESKLVRGLFFAGEVIDTDAFTGGYNLQIAFSTGALAGRCAAESAGKHNKGTSQ